jgi:hypothetical protein
MTPRTPTPSPCDDFQEQLRTAVELRSDAEPELRAPADADGVFSGQVSSRREPAHALECAECRTLWNEHVLLAQAIGEWRTRTPEIDLADRILHRWLEERDSECVDSEPGASPNSEKLAAHHVPPAPVSPAGNASPAVSPAVNATLVCRESPVSDSLSRQAAGAQKAVVAVVAVTLVSVIVAWSSFGPEDGSRIAVHRNEPGRAAGGAVASPRTMFCPEVS